MANPKHIEPVTHRLNGQSVSLTKVHCSACGQWKLITFRVPPEIASRVLIDHGWENPASAKKATCPECVAERRAQRVKTLSTPKETPMVTETPRPAPPKAEAPRQPSPADNRRISLALGDVYDVDKGRYAQAYTDDTVAAKLDVPRAWVEAVRSSFFGPGINEAQAEVPGRCDALLAQYQKLYTDSLDMAGVAEAAMKELKAIKVAANYRGV